MSDLGIKRISLLIIISLLLNIYFFAFLISPSQVQATDLTKAGMLLYRTATNRAVSTTDPILIVVRPSSNTPAEAQLRLDMSSSFTVAFASSGTVVMSTSGLPGTFDQTVLVALPHTGTGSVIANSVTNMVTIPINNLNGDGGTLYGILITSGVTNPASAGSVSTYVSTISTRDSTGGVLDVKKAAIQITSGSGDQVSVTANVPPTFTLNLPSASQTLALGALSTTSVISGAVNFTVYTNAGNGWVAWVRGASNGATNAALKSTATSGTIESVGTLNSSGCQTLTAGTEAYQLDADLTTDATGGGTPSISGLYNCTTTQGGVIGRATYAEVALSTGPANGDIITLNARVAIGNLTKAADDYADTWDVVGAGVF